ncbi:MAG: alpha-amylase [Chlorobium sp.]|uniref:alpha-amylase family glycosyl hydrolase n=1 Tax=Chlorobium sp. TaxID=1095 RepID=UPI0025C1E16A|nr:alpha-amylase family glycosyl hydrolase [Chlorobium sp.]MCF8383374.1 alpha-amylase [Chlorobium sp.]
MAKNTVERSLREIDFRKLVEGRDFYSSPAAWEDEVLYFLFLDRFSDGREFGGFSDNTGNPVTGPEADRNTPLFCQGSDAGSADRQTWFEAGRNWCGGTISGMKEKLGYLKRLGISAVWISPVFRQVTGSSDYHGYGIQNFLDVDPHFGTREELKDFVRTAHALGIRVILDIIINHAGDVFAYEGDRQYTYQDGRQWPVHGYRSRSGDPGSLSFGVAEDGDFSGAVWPVELQHESAWSRHGQIRNWDGFPEFLDGDFCTLKDVNLGEGLKDPSVAWDLQRRIREFRASQALKDLSLVYQFWIAYADIDGYRLDTVKHMEPGAVRYFATAVHEFAASIGKENFYIIGEITGGRSHATAILDTTGLDAALGINDMPDKLEFMVKGWRSPGNPDTEEQEGYFDLFRNSLLDNKSSRQWFGSHVVTMFDDHDQVGVKHKFRFAGDSVQSELLLPAALGLNLASAGIPCIYYGTEQAFNGADHRNGDDSYSDVFLRECMFGGRFGSRQSTHRHFFNEEHPVYRFISEVTALRRQRIELRRGRQYLRQVSATGYDGDFYYPQPIDGTLRWVIAWSRIFAGSESLCAINTDIGQALTVYAVVDSTIHPPGSTMQCLFSSAEDFRQHGVTVEARQGSAVRITVPAGGFVVYG